MSNETLIEILENRSAILKQHIEMDKKCYNDPFLSQHSRGRVSVEEKWLDETTRLIAELRKA